MKRFFTFKLLFFILGLLIPFMAFSSLKETSILKIDTLMNEADKKDIGLDKLSTAEQEALENWLNTFALKTLNKAYTSPQIEPTSSAPPPSIPKKKFLHVTDIKEDGSEIRLNNNSVWMINPISYYKVQSWFNRDNIKIHPSTQNDLYPYKIENLSNGQILEGKLKSGSTQQALENKYRKDYNRQRQTIHKVMERGRILQLSDMSLWKVAPQSLSYTQSWMSKDKISIDSSHQHSFSYKMRNRRTGKTALVKLLVEEESTDIPKEQETDFSSNYGFPKS